ncbi:MAG: hypothetical protein Q9187_000978 [Circinaria calcarea]
MDINSLLSPQDSPVDETPPAPPPSTMAATTKRTRRTKSSAPTSKVGFSPLSKATLPSDPQVHNAAPKSRPPLHSPPSSGSGPPILLKSISSLSTSSTENMKSDRQLSTSGMDTLADLASMQHHQQEARANAGGLRSTEVYDTQLAPAKILPNLHTLSRTPSISLGSLDLSMQDAPTQTPPRTFTATSLSESDLETVARLVSYLAENPYAYESHVQLVKLLHQGLITHVYGLSASTAHRDPHTYDLLQDLHQATAAMDLRFALGEDLWADRLQDQQLLANSLEDCIGVAETYKKAVQEETGSTKLWLMYGNWMLSLYNTAHGYETSSGDMSGTVTLAKAWSDEDKLDGKELFGRQQVLDTWQQGAEETKFRIHDSHLVWDRYTEFLMQDLGQAANVEAIAAMKTHFLDRLQIPHATWDQTFQLFSTFMSTYDNAMYEGTMVTANRQCAHAKTTYALREGFEMKLKRAVEAGDKSSEWNVYSEYLDWELSQSRKKKVFNYDLINALYQRANIRFPIDTNLWEDYLMFFIDEVDDNHRPHILALPVLERATRHCPWSGTLWQQYLQAAERENLPFTDIGEIKHKATSSGLLDAGGMEEILKVHTAWCGYLRRQAFRQDSTDEELDVAEVGIRSAIEDMETLGRQKYGKDYKGDPQYRLERIYIKYLSQSRNWKGARDTWKSLVARHGDSYEFWMRYYAWEMLTWGKLVHYENAAPNQVPSEATKVLRQAVKRPNMDWPEKIIDTFLSHCEDHENVAELQSALILTRKAMKAVTKKRAKEALDAAVTAQLHQQSYFAEATGLQDSPNGGKRKRGDAENIEDETIAKRTRSDVVETRGTATEEQPPSANNSPKRDRENATVIVKSLPPQTTETRVRQYFRDVNTLTLNVISTMVLIGLQCGTINSLKISLDNDGSSATATIEFDSKEDVLTAQTRDMKIFDGHSINVQVGSGSTLFVTNFPKTADEAYIREKFSQYMGLTRNQYGEIVDVRFPSLKFNNARRFCYLQFKSPSQAQAATELDGKKIDGKLTLLAKISDPTHKQERSGPLAEGREIYVSNVDWISTEGEIREVFSKYGKVESVRVPRNLAGKSKGIAFVVFSNRNEANAALELNLTKFKSRLLNVSVSTAKPTTRTTTVFNPTSPLSTSTSPQPEPAASNGTVHHSPILPSTVSQPPSSDHPTREEISSRTFALFNIPDTVNSDRIRALVEPYGAVVKITLRHDHRGAIIEFADLAGAGKAALGLDGYEISPGRKIGVGTVGEMMKEKAEWRSDRIGVGGGAGKKEKGKGNGEENGEEETKKALQAGAVIRRPGQATGRGGRRGRLGIKRGGTGLNGSRTLGHAGSGGGDEGARTETHESLVEGKEKEKDKEKGGPKSNADFKAMFLKG